MWFSQLTRLLETVTRDLAETITHFRTLERYSTAELSLARETNEFLRREMTEAKMGLVTASTERRQLELRLAASERDFEWARMRINQLERERGELFSRILDGSTGPSMHFVPTIEPKLSGRPTEPPTGGISAGTPLDDASRIAALINADIFADEREAEPDEPRPS